MSYGAHEAKFYYVPEVAFGTIPTAPAMVGIEIVENVVPSIDPSNIKLRGIGSRDLAAIKLGLRKPDLQVGYVVPSDGALDFLEYIFSLVSFTSEVIYDKSGVIVDLRYVGCRANKLSVGCSVEDVVKAVMDVMAQDLQTDTVKITEATYEDNVGAIPFSESFVWKGAADGTALAELESITDWKFNIENNLKRVPVIRNEKGYLAKYLQERQRVFTGEVTMDFESKDQFDEVIDDSEFSLKLGFGGYDALFTYCKWDNISSPTKIDDLVSMKLPFTARLADFETV